MNEEKKSLIQKVNELAALVTIGSPANELLTLEELKRLHKSLSDGVATRKHQLAASISTVSKMWEIMAVPACDQFPLDMTDLAARNLERIEGEKRRLFDLQKERFREMLAEQERDLVCLWDEIETPLAERQEILEQMRQYSAVETLEKQSALIHALKPIAEAHAVIRVKVEKRQALIQRMKEFELSAADPNRLFGSSFRLNQEERFRKAAYPTLVKIETDLLALLGEFREKNGADLRFGGQNVREAILEEKENRFMNDTLFFFTGKVNGTEEGEAVRPGGINGVISNLGQKRK